MTSFVEIGGYPIFNENVAAAWTVFIYELFPSGESRYAKARDRKTRHTIAIDLRGFLMNFCSCEFGDSG